MSDLNSGLTSHSGNPDRSGRAERSPRSPRERDRWANKATLAQASNITASRSVRVFDFAGINGSEAEN
jgi:hypothetical protein